MWFSTDFTVGVANRPPIKVYSLENFRPISLKLFIGLKKLKLDEIIYEVAFSITAHIPLLQWIHISYPIRQPDLGLKMLRINFQFSISTFFFFRNSTLDFFRPIVLQEGCFKIVMEIFNAFMFLVRSARVAT